jgi:conjugal transfer pilus assembly protein TraU
MKVLFRLVLVLASALWLPATSNAQQICNGKFPNLITDVCYDCIFPIGIMGGLLNLGVSGDDYDTGASKTPICVCVNNLGIGTPVSFWEPRYMVDTTTKPGCMPLLAGVDINTPYNAAE